MKLTQQAFIEKARRKHGDYYNYDKTVYRRAHEPITITCPMHGDFTQRACAHLNYGCRRCGNSRAADRQQRAEQFLAKAREVHDHRYDYRKVTFERQHGKVSIICPVHGVFEQYPNDHLKGHGCRRCGSELRPKPPCRTKAEYIEAARRVHGDRYDYELAEMVNSRDRIGIVCRRHGRFEQIAANHVGGNGCPTCGVLDRRIGYDEFVARARQVHGDRFDYADYAGMNEASTILCPEHGPFRQRAADHLGGAGCPRCGRETTRKRLRYTVEEIEDLFRQSFDHLVPDLTGYVDQESEITIHCDFHGAFRRKVAFILVTKHGCPSCAAREKGKPRLTQADFEERAVAVHGDKFSYGLFSGYKQRIEIACPTHGVFSQLPSNHLAGYGCPKCGTKFIMQNDWLDLMGIENREVYLPINGKRFIADGYDAATKTVYEFWGDFWHGNPARFASSELNTVTGNTFGELYERTQKKKRLIVEAGYNLIDIWENDWTRINGKHRKGGVRS